LTEDITVRDHLVARKGSVTRNITDSEAESYKLISRACMNAMLIPAVEVMRLFRRSTLANDLLAINRMAEPLLGEL
jgi:hypothetical protein